MSRQKEVSNQERAIMDWTCVLLRVHSQVAPDAGFARNAWMKEIERYKEVVWDWTGCSRVD